jgi:hypothetical protein
VTPQLTVEQDAILKAAAIVAAFRICCLVDVRMPPRDAPAPRFQIVHDGWSPSLHRCRFTRTEVPYGSLTDMKSLLIAAAREIALVHGWRAASGRRHGAMLPMPTDGGVADDGSALNIPIRHLSMDRSLVRTIAETAGILTLDETFREYVATPLATLMRSHGRSDDNHGDGGVRVSHALAPAGSGHRDVHEIAVRFRHSARSGSSTWIDGNRIAVNVDPLPETVVAASPGRPVSDVLDMGHAYDGRVVETISYDEDNGRLDIVLVPDLQQLGDAFDRLGVDLA